MAAIIDSAMVCRGVGVDVKRWVVMAPKSHRRSKRQVRKEREDKSCRLWFVIQRV